MTLDSSSDDELVFYCPAASWLFVFVFGVAAGGLRDGLTIERFPRHLCAVVRVCFLCALFGALTLIFFTHAAWLPGRPLPKRGAASPTARLRSRKP